MGKGDTTYTTNCYILGSEDAKVTNGFKGSWDFHI